MSADTPSPQILQKYAEVLIKFALNQGKGVRHGEVVLLEVPECAKPLLIELQKQVLKAGAHYITNFIPDETARHFFELAQDHHLDFFPSNVMRGKVDQADHILWIIAETNKHELHGISPQKIMQRSKAYKPYKDWREEKENQGKLSWTLALYATPAMAHEASLSIHEYWQQIIAACYLNDPNPIERWQQTFHEVERVRTKLNALPLHSLRLQAAGTDLTIGLDANRQWLGGSGHNIPSFEVFISPDWRRTQGHISIDQPLYRYGNVVKDIYLEFKEGIVTKATAKEGEAILKEMIATPNANKVGEFSLTDVRLSHITKFMAETLYDENFGGSWGNTHIALGSAYKESYPHNPAQVSKETWEAMGYNESVVHTDVVSTTNREVTATLTEGTSVCIYKDGKFTI